jgi:predicted nucleotidyltransferase
MTIEEICRKHRVALCYLFGSQQELGEAILKGEKPDPVDPEADVDFAVRFAEPPSDALTRYAALSLDLDDLVGPFKADLVFLHEVDSLIQLDAIRGALVFSADERFRERYEERVMAFAADALQVHRRNERDLFEAIDHGYFEFEYKAP